MTDSSGAPAQGGRTGPRWPAGKTKGCEPHKRMTCCGRTLRQKVLRRARSLAESQSRTRAVGSDPFSPAKAHRPTRRGDEPPLGVPK